MSHICRFFHMCQCASVCS